MTGLQIIGGEFLVNTATVGDQFGHQITALEDGRFVVTWYADADGDDMTMNGVTLPRVAVRLDQLRGPSGGLARPQEFGLGGYPRGIADTPCMPAIEAIR